MNEVRFTVAERYMLERLRDMIKAGEINEGIPRTTVEKKGDNSYVAHLKGFQSQHGKTVVDALSKLHDSLLTYHQRLKTTQLGDHSKQQLRVLESFLALPTCDCSCSPDNYCYCRGFQREE